MLALGGWINRQVRRGALGNKHQELVCFSMT